MIACLAKSDTTLADTRMLRSAQPTPLNPTGTAELKQELVPAH